MFSAYIIEIDDTTAGIIARDDKSRGNFYFYASSHIFYPLEGQKFASLDAAFKAARRLFRSRSQGKQRR